MILIFTFLLGMTLGLFLPLIQDYVRSLQARAQIARQLAVQLDNLGGSHEKH